ncbi:hypothetical protein [Limosilactobacillus mucosae]|uniref:hypothetical protein n=1 Tax=Limosilactobacillus mucosae TaxID=97478 RepID=UPI0008820C5B|nr:hypothetical protein [Limosilactobacillus mucosae]SDN00958.1 hypothetical protein SAMN05216430_10257 [Limosilactobacillus mucosae]SEK44852.1 hypothetical protein SAMN05216545_102186 [Limosilactobacillus mucosae]SFJ90974.1 hypothetical protein SAMN05216461_10257 [Limosilactobacillus mucosae]
MTSLIDLEKAGKIEKTGATIKLPTRLNNLGTENMDVYRIPLKYLYYNDKNGRISTAIAGYHDELNPVNDTVDPAYNDFVAKLIEQNNPAALKRTQKSIQESGQRICGYVLEDGRIVDGNRRYTALRNLQKATGKTYYFEAVILPFSYDNQTDRSKIKKLELAIQMGVEKREDYDPVDLAVDIYQTTTGDDAMMTLADYVNVANMKKKEAERYYQGAVYMREFLKFIGADENNYNLIKENQIWSPFYEMGKSLTNNFGDDADSQVQKNETMHSYFGLILHDLHVGVSGTPARTHMRDFTQNIVKSPNLNEFNDEVSDTVEDLADTLQESPINLMTQLTEANDNISQFGDTYDTYIRDAKNGESVEKFIKSIKDSVKYYEDLNNNGGLAGTLRYGEISNEQLKQLQAYMRKLDGLCKDLFNKYGNEIR